MHKNQIWLAFLATVALAAIWFTANLAFVSWNYYNLKESTNADSIEYSIERISSEKYLLKGDYTYTHDGKNYSSSSILSEPVWRNSWSAKEALEYFPKKEKSLWFDPKNPHESALEKKFPYKEGIYAALVWGILIYFIWLGYYVNRKLAKEI